MHRFGGVIRTTDSVRFRRMSREPHELYADVDDRIIAALADLDPEDAKARIELESDKAFNLDHSHHASKITHGSEAASGVPYCAVDDERMPCSVTKMLAGKYGIEVQPSE